MMSRAFDLVIASVAMGGALDQALHSAGVFGGDPPSHWSVAFLLLTVALTFLGAAIKKGSSAS